MNEVNDKRSDKVYIEWIDGEEMSMTDIEWVANNAPNWYPSAAVKACQDFLKENKPQKRGLSSQEFIDLPDGSVLDIDGLSYVKVNNVSIVETYRLMYPDKYLGEMEVTLPNVRKLSEVDLVIDRFTNLWKRLSETEWIGESVAGLVLEEDLFKNGSPLRALVLGPEIGE